ncbi:hypothetical protein DPSP01_014777 [Paraphaeosphaeria sporulosa]
MPTDQGHSKAGLGLRRRHTAVDEAAPVPLHEALQGGTNRIGSAASCRYAALGWPDSSVLVAGAKKCFMSPSSGPRGRSCLRPVHVGILLYLVQERPPGKMNKLASKRFVVRSGRTLLQIQPTVGKGALLVPSLALYRAVIKQATVGLRQ